MHFARDPRCNRRPCDGSKLCRIHQADAAKHDGVPVHGFIDGRLAVMDGRW